MGGEEGGCCLLPKRGSSVQHVGKTQRQSLPTLGWLDCLPSANYEGKHNFHTVGEIRWVHPLKRRSHSSRREGSGRSMTKKEQTTCRSPTTQGCELSTPWSNVSECLFCSCGNLVKTRPLTPPPRPIAWGGSFTVLGLSGLSKVRGLEDMAQNTG